MFMQFTIFDHRGDNNVKHFTVIERWQQLQPLNVFYIRGSGLQIALKFRDIHHKCNYLFVLN